MRPQHITAENVAQIDLDAVLEEPSMRPQHITAENFFTDSFMHVLHVLQ